MAEKKFEIFSCWSNLIQSHVDVMKKGLFLFFFSRSLQITYLITLSLEKEIIVLEKVWKKSGILDEKSVRTLCKWSSLSRKFVKIQKSCYHENLTLHLCSLSHLLCVTEY